MMRNYFKTAVRTLWKEKRYTLIHVFGLTVGMAACLLIGTVVIDELSYDRQWSRSEDTYRLLTIQESGSAYSQKGGTVYAGLAPTLKQQFPEVEDYSEIYPMPIHFKIEKSDPVAAEAVILHADTSAIRFLDVELLAHEDLTPVGDINKIIISESFGERYFTGKDPIGQRIFDVPNYDEKANEYVVAGIMKDIPPNTHLRGDMILLKDRKEHPLAADGRGPGMRYVRNYIMLRPGTDPLEFEKKMNAWYSASFTDSYPLRFGLQPMADIYLKTDFAAYQPVKGNIQHSYIFAAVAILLLLIACANYVNLNIARASSRLKDTGIRKILGASRGRILTQALLESVLVFGMAMILAFVCYYFARPALEVFIGHSLAFNFAASYVYLAYALILMLAICLFSGLYPAWLVSGFRGVGNMQRVLNTGSAAQSWLRKSLVVLQFSISIAILIALLVVQQQVNFLKNQEVGYDTNGLLSINHVSWDNKSNTLRTELLGNPAIMEISFTNWRPTDGAGQMVREISNPQNPSEKIELWYMDGEPNMAQTLGLELQSGRFLDFDRQADAVVQNDFEAMSALRPALLTASTARMLGIDSLNQPLHGAGIIPVGIVADFNSESLHKASELTAIVGYRNPAYGALLLRVLPGREQDVMREVASVWKEIYPDKLFDIQIVQETLAKQYQAEEKLQNLFRVFSMLTMLLAAMGILGLIVHALGLRVKEIGIRKVLGASVSGIVAMLSKDFVKLVCVAIVIASPIAWWAMNQWLADFAYRIEIQWWMFALAGIAAVVVALLTVASQAIRAAMANPVDSLRDE